VKAAPVPTVRDSGDARKGQEKGKVSASPAIQLANLKETLARRLPTLWCKTRRSARKTRKLMTWLAFSRTSKLFILNELGRKERGFGRGEWIRTTGLLVPNQGAPVFARLCRYLQIIQTVQFPPLSQRLPKFPHCTGLQRVATSRFTKRARKGQSQLSD